MNIAGLLERHGRSAAGSIALRHAGRDHLTYGELAHRVAALSAHLARSGLEPGDRVGILQWNGPPLLESLLACFHGGFIAVPANARLTPSETSQIFGDSGVRALVYGEEYDSHVADFGDVHLVVIGEGNGTPYHRAIEDGAPWVRSSTTSDDELGWLFYTSGTTGRMKGATLSHRNLMEMVLAYLADIRTLRRDSLILHCAPLTHGSGLYALPAIARGSEQIIVESRSYDPEEVLTLVEELDVTDVAFLAPTMVKRLVETQEASDHDLASLQNIVYGGAPMYLDDIKEAMSVMGPVFTQIYGQAEAPVSISRLSRAEHDLALKNEDWELLISAGRPYTNVDVGVASEDDREVRVSGEGEIVARGDVVMQGYWEAPEATSETIRDGWLHTGDLGRIADDGYVYLLDRNKDVIITGGSNVYPREVEEVLLDHPSIRSVAVVGAPDDHWGERVVAVVVKHPGSGDKDTIEAELVEACRRRLAGYKLPRQFEWRTELPTSSYGKILKRELRDEFWEGRDRRI